jgi:hypothetical protein
VYENLAVLPRFRLVSRLETLTSPQDVLERVGSIFAREMLSPLSLRRDPVIQPGRVGWRVAAFILSAIRRTRLVHGRSAG